jgi:hypothetical protein
MKKEANDYVVHYVPAAVELRRRERAEKRMETKPMDGMIANRDRCAARMAEWLGVPVKQFDGLSVPYIEKEVLRIKQERGESTEGVEKIVWDAVGP